MKLSNFNIGLDQPFFLIAGNCVIESEQLAIDTASTLKEITTRLGINFIYKTSFEKANRTSYRSYRGVGLDDGLRIMAKIKAEVGVPVLTDVHEDTPLDEVVAVVDVLQTPAFLCRQTNFIARVMACNKPVNIKKGQFLSPWEMVQVVDKARAFIRLSELSNLDASKSEQLVVEEDLSSSAAIAAPIGICEDCERRVQESLKENSEGYRVGDDRIMVCERGYVFGYNNLVVDMRSLAVMRQTGCPVIFDVGHAVQQPGMGGNGCYTGGQSEFIAILARAGIAAGISGLFIETHPNPEKALCDGPNSLPLKDMEQLLVVLKELDATVKRQAQLTQEMKK